MGESSNPAFRDPVAGGGFRVPVIEKMLSVGRPAGWNSSASSDGSSGNSFSEAQVFGSIDLAHFAGAQSRLNFVTTEFCTYGKGHLRFSLGSATYTL